MTTFAPRFRPAAESDRELLVGMLKLTETWRDPSKGLPDYFPTDLQRYVDQWTPAQGGVVLEVADGTSDYRPVGAAWLRQFTADDPGYGFVEERYPEVAIAIESGFTGQGLGTRLLHATLEFARQAGHPGVSLSVEVDNTRAVNTYEKLGFVNRGLDEHGEAYTMLYRFDTTAV